MMTYIATFYSTTYGEKDKAYISALRNELRLRANYLQQDGQMPVIETIYIGGGTPSTLDTSLLEPIFEVLYRTYHVSDRAEITIEANPDDLTPRKIKSLRTLPVNRLSMGCRHSTMVSCVCSTADITGSKPSAQYTTVRIPDSTTSAST